jgi:hypothetical protein
MTTWLLIRRLRGPAFLLLVGLTALLNEWDILSFSRSWPLYLILLGLLGLAERAALSQAQMDAYDPITGQPRGTVPTGYPNQAGSVVPPPAGSGTDVGLGRP